jgi:hypothetical protein
MAKKPDNKVKDTKADKKAPKSAKSGVDATAKSAGRKPSTPSVAARIPLESVGKPASSGKAAKKDAKANKKAAKLAKTAALNLVPKVSAPSLPQVDVVQTAKEIGGQLMSVLNTDAGRVIAAEVLIYLAKSLTKAAANTEAGKDATETVLNAGAKIGAAVASAGAKAMDTGSNAASSGAEAAVTATDIAREVAQVAVSTVGGVAVEVAQKVLKRRGRSANKDADRPTSGGANTSAPSGTESPSPALPA